MKTLVDLSGKKILVTGASSGIGRATAIECSKMGAKVIITASSPESAQAAVAKLKEKYPNIKTYVWTGYLLEDLKPEWLENIDVLIDGPFILEQRDITLKLRGSHNQRVLYKNIDF